MRVRIRNKDNLLAGRHEGSSNQTHVRVRLYITPYCQEFAINTLARSANP